MSDISIITQFSLDHAKENALLEAFYAQFLEDNRGHVENYDEVMHIVTHPSVDGICNSGKRLWFITHAGETIGFVTFMGLHPPYQKCVGICDFFIAKVHRGRGLGRRALQVVVARLFTCYREAQRIGLSVFSSNEAAKALYTGMGFNNNLEVMLLERPQPPSTEKSE